MKMRTAGIFLGITCSALLVSGCGGKQSATQVAEESETTEKEGAGEDAETEAAIREAEEANASEEDMTEEKASANDEEAKPEPLALIGIALPADTQEGRMDSALLSEGLAEKNLEVQLTYAENDPEKQIKQLRELIGKEPALLIVDPVDPYSLAEVLEEASEKGISIFSYEDLIMDSGNVGYYLTFDKRSIGQQIGEAIVQKKDLKRLQSAGESASIEFFMGAEDNLGGLFLFNGVLEVLGSYLEDGTLYCPSGQLTYEETSTPDFDTEKAAERYRTILEEAYPAYEQPDIICSGFDGACYGILEALEEADIYPGSSEFPLINGVGSEAEAVRAIAENRIAFDIYMERKKLTDLCISMVNTICVEGEKPEVNNYEQYDNGVKLIRTNTCSAEVIDVDNYEMLIDKGVFTTAEVKPRFTPTPIPTVTPVPTQTPIPTATPVPTQTPIPTATPVPTEKLIPTATPVPTEKPIPTATPVPTEKPLPTATSVPTAASIPTQTPILTATPAPTQTPAPAAPSKKE